MVVEVTRPRTRAAPKKPPRRRRDAAVARADILDAAERRLVIAGPSGIRLQEVAADAGVSHPTVLHHFGSREELVKAVIVRALRGIHASLVEAIHTSEGEESKLATMLESVFAALAGSGHARVIVWLALEGYAIEEAGAHLGDVVDAAHALRIARHRGKSRPTREDTAHTVVLAALATLASAIVGPTMLANAGLGPDPPAGARFRTWLAKRLWQHLEAGGS